MRTGTPEHALKTCMHVLNPAHSHTDAVGAHTARHARAIAIALAIAAGGLTHARSHARSHARTKPGLKSDGRPNSLTYPRGVFDSCT